MALCREEVMVTATVTRRSMEGTGWYQQAVAAAMMENAMTATDAVERAPAKSVFVAAAGEAEAMAAVLEAAMMVAERRQAED